ncbi:MAG: internal scaffolding protein [Microvirus sp.]|nr:MAG: internal scaffolding protein [Microvirus sp.]
MFIRSAYNYNRAEVSDKTGLECKDISLTVQDQAEDVNELVRKFGITGKIPQNIRIPLSGDFTGVGTYQECLQAVKDADIAFLELPASIREHFRHDPDRLIKFMENPKISKEDSEIAEKIGLFNLKKMATERTEAKPKESEVAKNDNIEKTKS